MFINMTLIMLKQRWPAFERYSEDVPLVLERNGTVSIIPKR